MTDYFCYARMGHHSMSSPNGPPLYVIPEWATTLCHPRMGHHSMSSPNGPIGDPVFKLTLHTNRAIQD